ncbi:response regulator [Candidatus Parcubacteria bacterium]|nr:response regulator [Candidatus Parcubacteria bacterium]
MKKVLVVEDRDIDFYKIEKGLVGKVEIMRAETQSETKKLFQENPDVDLIIMDFRVPGDTPNTISLVKEIVESGYNEPIIASSLMYINRQQLIEAGATNEADKNEVAKLALGLLGL